MNVFKFCFKCMNNGKYNNCLTDYGKGHNGNYQTPKGKVRDNNKNCRATSKKLWRHAVVSVAVVAFDLPIMGTVGSVLFTSMVRIASQDKAGRLSSCLVKWPAWTIIGERGYDVFHFCGSVVESSLEFTFCLLIPHTGIAYVGLSPSLSYRTTICEHILSDNRYSQPHTWQSL